MALEEKDVVKGSLIGDETTKMQPREAKTTVERQELFQRKTDYSQSMGKCFLHSRGML